MRESALKRVIWSRGRYQVQTSFGAYRRAARTLRASAICKWRYVLSIRMYARVRARARDLLLNKFVQRCKSVGLWEVYAPRVTIVHTLRAFSPRKSECKINHTANDTVILAAGIAESRGRKRSQNFYARFYKYRLCRTTIERWKISTIYFLYLWKY